MKLQEFLDITYTPLEGTATRINIYSDDKCDIPIDDFETLYEYKFSPDSLVVSLARIGMNKNIFNSEMLEKEIIAVYPENGEMSIVLGG